MYRCVVCSVSVSVFDRMPNWRGLSLGGEWEILGETVSRLRDDDVSRKVFCSIFRGHYEKNHINVWQ